MAKGGQPGNKNAVGNKGGKSLQDRKLASKVRSLALTEIQKVLLNGREDKLFDPILLKLAGTVLPRLNEHSGPDGETLNLNSYDELTTQELRRRIEELEGGGHKKGTGEKTS